MPIGLDTKLKKIKETQPLDSAESSKILADYLTRILREIFDYIDDGDSIVRDRVNLCNGILLYIRACTANYDMDA